MKVRRLSTWEPTKNKSTAHYSHVLQEHINSCSEPGAHSGSPQAPSGRLATPALSTVPSTLLTLTPTSFSWTTPWSRRH